MMVLSRSFFSLFLLASASAVYAQSVCLPSPRLLTTMPMGGQAGSTVEVSITGESMEDVEELRFSHPGITATPKRDDAGNVVENQFVVNIAADCPPGVHEARTISRLGVSSSRVFNVGTLPEVTRTAANTTLDAAMLLAVDSLCNAYMTKQAVDHYSFEAQAGERIVVDCAAPGIDSKAKPVLIVADAEGNDLQVERRGGAVEFSVPADGRYVVKVHDLTFEGGKEYFYRLALQRAAADVVVPRLPSTATVNSVSWPPPGLPADASLAEIEPNNAHAEAQSITFPCDIAGSFYPAADVDTYEFAAKKGDVWWVEVASERLGRPTDPSIVVQRVTKEGDKETLADVVELSDISSPVKVSSNGYAYDGPPYNAGTADINGKIDIPEDGTYRLQLRDLFGGTRNDPLNTYRMVVRQAQPDFSIVGWALHMELRNGDRNALSKPISLRGGATVAFEVVVIRRDGFDGSIDLLLENLPVGVTATGLTIPAGKSRGIMLITADQDAPRGLTSAAFSGRATINGEEVTRTGRLASMAWPVTNHWSEVPAPRLLADIPVSACGTEFAPVTIAAADDRVWEAKVGEKLTIPLVLTRRCDFSGPKISLKTFGDGFEGNPAFDAPLDADAGEAVLDLEKLKTQPGEYTIAFYGSAVAKYRYHPEAVTFAELALQQAKEQAEAITAEAKRLAEAAQSASDDQKAELEQAAKDAAAQQKSAETAIETAEKSVQKATKQAEPKDIVDIVVSSPIHLRVTAAEASESK
ncbi:MAG: serine protease [Planctomycetaceae bacterium]|nr:serine protease [Planctomycetaceae bacterium]